MLHLVYSRGERFGSLKIKRSMGIESDNEQEAAMPREFLAFLKQYGVIGLAIAVIIGGKANALGTALVDGILMPIVTCFIPGGTWRTATLNLGPVHFLLGPVLGAGLDFVIVAWFVFWFSKWVLKEQTVTRK